MKTNDKLMVNVASGIFVMDKYTNLDNSPFLSLVPFYYFLKFILSNKYSDQIEKFVEATKKAKLIKADCRKPLPFNDASIDHIYCSHFLEHLYQDEAINSLNDFYKKLKVGGTIHLIVPDLAEYVDDYIKRKNGDSSADKFIQATTLTWPKRPSFLFRFFNFIEGYGLTHLWMYDRQSLTQKVLAAGFKLIPLEKIPVPTIERDGLQITAIKL